MALVNKAINVPPLDKGKAMLFVVEAEVGEGDSGTVRGTISSHYHKVDVLFDSGCTHSFIASCLVKSLGLQTCHLPQPFRVTTTKGESEVIELGIADLSFDIQRSAYNWDFIMYELKVNDLILDLLVVYTKSFTSF